MVEGKAKDEDKRNKEVSEYRQSERKGMKSKQGWIGKGWEKKSVCQNLGNGDWKQDRKRRREDIQRIKTSSCLMVHHGMGPT